MTNTPSWKTEPWINFNPHLPYGRWPKIFHKAMRFYNFNPHLPYGRWREGSGIITLRGLTFQSTPSLRKVTSRTSRFYTGCSNFNPHLPYGRWRFSSFLIKSASPSFQSTPSLRKVTLEYADWRLHIINFNPHLPYGRWLMVVKPLQPIMVFQSTPSLRKVTTWYFCWKRCVFISIHTFLTEGDAFVTSFLRFA